MMLKRITSIAAAALLIVPTALAQENKSASVTVEKTANENGRVILMGKKSDHPVRLYRFQEGWSLGIGAGAQMYLGDNDKYTNFGDWVSPTFYLDATKWITSGIGVKLGLDFAQMNGLWRWSRYADPVRNNPGTALYRGWSGTPYKLVDGSAFFRQSTWMYCVSLNVTLDVRNLIEGYRQDRLWHTVLYAGAGLLGSFGYQFPEDLPAALKTGATSCIAPCLNAGWLNTFRLAKRLDLNIDVRGKIIPEEFDGEVGKTPVDAVIGLAAGLTWRF